MPVLYHCPHCRQPVTVPDHVLGRAVGCPHCRHPFQTFPAQPTPPAAPAAPLPPGQTEPLSLDDDDPPPPTRPRKPEGAFENLDDEDDEPPRRRASRAGRRPEGVPLPNRLGIVFAIVATAVAVGIYKATQRPVAGFDFTQMLVAALAGGLGAGGGYLLGKALETPAGGYRRRTRGGRDDDDDD